MSKKTLTSIAFLAGCAMSAAFPGAQAQTVNTEVLTSNSSLNPGDRANRTAAPTIKARSTIVFWI